MSEQLLPRSLAPAQGEAIDGYLERLSWRLRTPLVELLHRLGLTSRPGYDSLPRGLTIQLSSDQAAGFCAAAGVLPEELESMLLAQFDGICLSLRGYTPGQPASIRELAVREWLSATASWACPRCLADADQEVGAAVIWRIGWRLPWTYACQTHQTLLAARCPSCGLPLRSGGVRASSLPSFTSLVLEPGLCRNSTREHPRAASHPCGHELARCPAVLLPPESRPMQAATVFAHTISSRRGTVTGARVASLDYFRAARSLAALTLRLATTDDLGTLPPATIEAFGNYAQARGERSRFRPYTALPRDPALVAAISPFIVETLSAEVSDAATVVASLLDRLPREQRRTTLLRHLCIPASLRPVFDVALTLSHEPSLGERLRSRPGPARAAVDAIPQLLWADIFERDFAPLFPHVKTNFARRFCSLALAARLLDADWENAATHLELPPTQSRALARSCSTELRRAGTEPQFIDLVDRLANQVAHDKTLPNQAARRQRLGELSEIPAETWEAICAQASVLPGTRTRRRYAAIWLWCDMTGGDYQLAPQLVDEVSGRRHPAVTRYGRYVRTHAQLFTEVGPYLRAYGAALLDDA